MLQNRILHARGMMERLQVDLLVVTALPNIRYLSGFTGSDGVLLLTKDAGRLLVDGRYITQAHDQVTLHEIECYKSKHDEVRSSLIDFAAKRVAFEAERMSVALHTALFGKDSAVETVPLTTELDDLRQCKDPFEIEMIAQAASIASAAVLDVLKQLVPGSPEQDIALAIEYAMKLAGAEGCAFDFIVASGERGALPHGRASVKPIRRGELVTIDFGAIYNGYYSDETVTVSVGTPDAKQREIYSIVKDAHDMAIQALHPGVPLAEIDAIARDHIDKLGYGEYFSHGLGHGVGLEIHERPVVNSKSTTVAEQGMVFTIEPGIYIPGWGGVRIEDTVLVTTDGCQLLTKINKDLIVAAV